MTMALARWACAAGDPGKLEAEGARRMAADLTEAEKLGRPHWLRETSLEIPLVSDHRKMRREVDSQFYKGKCREAVKILYALIDRGSGKAKSWAEYYLPQGLVWAKAFPFAMIKYREEKPTPYNLLNLARCYLEYDQFAAAEELFAKARTLAEQLDQKNVLEANAWRGIGDVRRERGDFDEAKAAYRQACDAFERESKIEGKKGWYIANVRKQMSRMRFLMKLCDAGSLDVATLRPGTYAGEAGGYDGPISVSVTIAGGKIAKVTVTSQVESIPLDCFSEIPRRIVDTQTPSVDAITGATVTSVGVMGAVLKALEQAK